LSFLRQINTLPTSIPTISRTLVDFGDPQTDEDRALVSEYKRGVARAAGTATFGAVVAATTYAAPHAAPFFELVVHNAAAIREYLAIAFHSPQLTQVIDAIEYVRLKLTEGD
jgi:hypothetical protein